MNPCLNKDDLANHAQCTALHKPSFLGCPAAVNTREIIGSVVIVGNPVLRRILIQLILWAAYLPWCFSYHIQMFLLAKGLRPLKRPPIRTQIEGSGLLTLPSSGAAIWGASLGTGAKQQRPNVRQQVKGVDGVHHSDPNSCQAQQKDKRGEFH